MCRLTFETNGLKALHFQLVENQSAFNAGSSRCQPAPPPYPEAYTGFIRSFTLAATSFFTSRDGSTTTAFGGAQCSLFRAGWWWAFSLVREVGFARPDLVGVEEAAAVAPPPPPPPPPAGFDDRSLEAPAASFSAAVGTAAGSAM